MYAQVDLYGQQAAGVGPTERITELAKLNVKRKRFGNVKPDYQKTFEESNVLNDSRIPMKDKVAYIRRINDEIKRQMGVQVGLPSLDQQQMYNFPGNGNGQIDNLTDKFDNYLGYRSQTFLDDAYRYISERLINGTGMYPQQPVNQQIVEVNNAKEGIAGQINNAVEEIMDYAGGGGSMTSSNITNNLSILTSNPPSTQYIGSNVKSFGSTNSYPSYSINSMSSSGSWIQTNSLGGAQEYAGQVRNIYPPSPSSVSQSSIQTIPGSTIQPVSLSNFTNSRQLEESKGAGYINELEESKHDRPQYDSYLHPNNYQPFRKYHMGGDYGRRRGGEKLQDISSFSYYSMNPSRVGQKPSAQQTMELSRDMLAGVKMSFERGAQYKVFPGNPFYKQGENRVIHVLEDGRIMLYKDYDENTFRNHEREEMEREEQKQNKYGALPGQIFTKSFMSELDRESENAILAGRSMLDDRQIDQNRINFDLTGNPPVKRILFNDHEIGSAAVGMFQNQQFNL